MRFKESIQLDTIIKERRASIDRDDLSEFEKDKRVLALAVLIEARNRLDEIGDQKELPDVREHVKFIGTDEDGRKIRPRRRRDLRSRHPVVHEQS